MTNYKSKRELNLTQNKDMKINSINGIYLDNFRKFHSQKLNLGNNLTIIFGRNGTLKSSTMGLIAQPFRSNKKNIFDKKMETKLSDVFKLSLDKDDHDYLYHIKMNINNDLRIEEPIPLYKEKNPDTNDFSRFRLVPSGRNQGDGYFNLPSVYTKLDRLYPLIDFKNDPTEDTKVTYSKSELKLIGDIYENVLLRPFFKSSDNYDIKSTDLDKHTFAPSNSYYDINSISSGEDNLSTFINTMISFQRIYDKSSKQLTGVWSIDEFEASLHPIAQNNLLQYLYNWSRKYKVQIILNTHSLSLIKYSYYLKTKDRNNNIILNLISDAYADEDQLNIIENPPYKDSYSELTLSSIRDSSVSQKIHITIFCEDSTAKEFLNSILKNRKIKKFIDWEFEVNTKNSGSSYVLLEKLCENYPKILNELNAIVIFDADQQGLLQNKITYTNSFVIPSVFGQPIEKELVSWILSLNGSDPFFKNFKKSQTIFKQEFAQFKLPLDNQNENINIIHYKKWYLSDAQEHRKYRTYYIKKNSDIFKKFETNIYDIIVELLNSNGITFLI